MGFGTEMRDFVAAFKIGSDIQDRRKQRELEAEQEKNRTAENAAQEARIQRNFETSQEGIKTRHADSMGMQERRIGISESNLDISRGNLDLQRDNAHRAELVQADAAWYKQLEADPQSGYGPDGEMIPPPSQRGNAGGAATEAIPTGPEGMSNGAVDEAPAEAVEPVDDVEINYPTVGKAIYGGMKLLQKLFADKGIQDGAEAPGLKAMMEGDGALKPETVKAVDGILDPDGVLPEQKLTLGRLEATYEFYTSGKYKGKDGVERANEAAAQWIQTARGIAAINAHTALVKLKNGDVDGAADQLVKMHDAIPDMQSTTYDRETKTYQTTDDQTGEVVQEGEVTPELIEQMATAFVGGPAFYEVVMQAAMRSKNFNPGAGDKAAKVEKPRTSEALAEADPADTAELNDQVGEAIVEMVSKELADIDGNPIFANVEEFVAMVGEDSADALNDLGVMIAVHNRSVSPEEAAKLALLITNPDEMVGSPEDQHMGFEVLPVTKDNIKAGIDIMEIKTSNGIILKLPGSQANDAIKTANRGLFIAAKENIQKKVDMTNERVRTDNESYTLERLEEERKSDKLKTDRSPGSGSRGAKSSPQKPKSGYRPGLQ